MEESVDMCVAHLEGKKGCFPKDVVVGRGWPPYECSPGLSGATSLADPCRAVYLYTYVLPALFAISDTSPHPESMKNDMSVVGAPLVLRD